MSYNVLIAANSKDEFMRLFSNLYEHSPWIVEAAYEKIASLDDISIDDFHSILTNIVIEASADKQNKLINAHPMLVTKKSSDEELTKFSKDEQNAAGLKHLSQKDSDKFNNLNQQYFDKFGFPFIMAVKYQNKETILEQLLVRQNNTKEKERQIALQEINKIALLRINEIYGI